MRVYGHKYATAVTQKVEKQNRVSINIFEKLSTFYITKIEICFVKGGFQHFKSCLLRKKRSVKNSYAERKKLSYN